MKTGHYFVMFMLDGSTERIDCCGKEHAETVYNAIKAHAKKLCYQIDGKIKNLAME